MTDALIHTFLFRFDQVLVGEGADAAVEASVNNVIVHFVGHLFFLYATTQNQLGLLEYLPG